MPPESLPDISRWQVLGMEFIVFPVDPTISLSTDGWKQFTGDDPQESIKKKIERMENGLFQDKMLIFAAQPLRMSWAIAPKIDENTSLPSIGSFTSIRDWFGSLVEAWLAANTIPLKRIGFAGKLALPTDDTRESYLLLDHLLPSAAVDPDSSDFMFQVNRSRPSQAGVPSLIINRLSVWSSYIINVEISAKNELLDAGESAQISESRVFGCLWRFDFNTSHKFASALPKDKLTTLAKEILDLATEVGEKGDVK